MADFVPGMRLSGLFYQEVVGPILETHFPGLIHSAGQLGPGSEVLGFDTEMSTDHSWGPRLDLFLSEGDHDRLGGDIDGILAHELPFSFRGYPTHFEPVPGDPGSEVPQTTASWPIRHLVKVTTVEGFTRQYLGIEPEAEMAAADWLTVPEQKLRSVAAGAVFHDGLNALEPLRRKLAYYPHGLWLYLLSAQWQRIGQEEPFVGRAGVVGDEVGSAVIAARLVRDVMRLCLLIERHYAPYPKWFGTAFAQLACAERLTPILEQVLVATCWQDREVHLSSAYEIVAAMHNDLGLTEPVASRVSQFHDRPFLVIQAGRIADLLWEAIEDEEILALPFGVGMVDQYVDSTDILSHTKRCRHLLVLYGG
jgi:hypothetical protein